MIDNYIYLYHTDTFIVLPSFPENIQDSLVDIIRSLMSTSLVEVLAPAAVRAVVNMLTADMSGQMADIFDAIEFYSIDNETLAADLLQIVDILAAVLDLNAIADVIHGEDIRINDVDAIEKVLEEVFELNILDHVFSPVIANLVELFLNVDLANAEIQNIDVDAEQAEIVNIVVALLNMVNSLDVTTVSGLMPFVNELISGSSSSKSSSLKIISGEYVSLESATA